MATTKVPVSTVRRVLEKLYEERHVSAETRSALLHKLRFKTPGLEIEIDQLPERVRTAVRSELAAKPVPAST